MADRWNLVVIGAGPGGYEAAVEGARKGMRVALVENRELGGTCLNRGCIPTKTILHTAELYHELQSGPSIGLRTDQAAVDIAMVQQRKQEVLNQLRAGIAALMKTNKIAVYSGTGTIVDRCHVSVRPESGEPVLLETDHILIATGSVPACPPIPGALPVRPRNEIHPPGSPHGNPRRSRLEKIPPPVQNQPAVLGQPESPVPAGKQQKRIKQT